MRKQPHLHKNIHI